MKKRDGGKEISLGGPRAICLYTDTLGMFAEAPWCIYVCPCDWMWGLNKAREDSWPVFTVSGSLCDVSFVWWRYNLKVARKRFGISAFEGSCTNCVWLPFHLSKLIFGILWLSMSEAFSVNVLLKLWNISMGFIHTHLRSVKEVKRYYYTRLLQMAQWVQVLAGKSDITSLTPGIHHERREATSGGCPWTSIWMCPYLHISIIHIQ